MKPRDFKLVLAALLAAVAVLFGPGCQKQPVDTDAERELTARMSETQP
jgi:hypothetical protein